MRFESSGARSPLRHRFRGQKWYQLGTGQERLYKTKNDAGVRGYVPELGNTHNLLEKLKLSLPKVNTSNYKTTKIVRVL